MMLYLPRIMLVSLFVLMLFSFNAEAQNLVACVNPKKVSVYATPTLDKDSAYIVPEKSVAWIDLFIRSISGKAFISGIVTRGDKLLKVDGNRRWYLKLDDWDCRIVDPNELEVKWIGLN